MKGKKQSPLFFAGMGLFSIGIVLNVISLFSKWEHNWIAIPFLLIAAVLLAVNAANMRKE